jgi:hypothetical protein
MTATKLSQGFGNVKNSELLRYSGPHRRALVHFNRRYAHAGKEIVKDVPPTGIVPMDTGSTVLWPFAEAAVI